MWIETETEGEYLNPAMIERVAVRGGSVTAHMSSGAAVVITTNRTTDEGTDALTNLMRMTGNPLE
jgi:hypothetical protein